MMPALAEVLQCDRCFLYLRNPQTKFGKVDFCYDVVPSSRISGDAQWKEEPASCHKKIPCLQPHCIAIRLCLSKTETANPEVVTQLSSNKTWARASLCAKMLYGGFTTVHFCKPRVWTEKDRSIIAQLEKKLTPFGCCLC